MPSNSIVFVENFGFDSVIVCLMELLFPLQSNHLLTLFDPSFNTAFTLAAFSHNVKFSVGVYRSA